VDRDDETFLELEAPRPANTSTSHTLVLSEEPQVAPEASAPPRSPQALKKKKARMGASSKEEIIVGSLFTPLLDDVRYLLLSCHFLYLLEKFPTF
jgi:hypothetical protein